MFLVAAGALASPWYVYNQSRFGSPFGYQFVDYDGIPVKPHVAMALTPANAGTFFLGFSRTLFRGELLWGGRYFDIVPGWINIAVFGVLAGLLFVLGALSYRSRPLAEDGFERAFFLVGGMVLLTGMFILYFVEGSIPYYLARYAFGGLYCVMFLFSAGWRTILRSESFAIAVPALLLLVHNVIYTVSLLAKVLG